MARFFWWLVGVPLGAVVVALAVANRRPVTLSWDPFAPDNLEHVVAVPGYLLVLGSLILGVVVGGVAVWLSQGRHRREERRWREAAQRLEQEVARDAAPPRLAAPAQPRRAA